MKKRILSMLIAIAMVAGLVPSVSLTAVAAAADITVNIDTGASVTLKDTDGDGAYEIGNADQLYAFAAAVNGGNGEINGELTKDIVVNQNVLKADGTLNGDGSNFRAWTPIGEYKSKEGVGYVSYEGTFDGNDHTISGLYFNDTNQNYVGLFGYLSGKSKVQNVGVSNSYFRGARCVGGVVGSVYNGTVINCCNMSTIESRYTACGGVVGINYYGTITNCYNIGYVRGLERVGGIVGENAYGSIISCRNSGTVTATEVVSSASKYGGVAGSNGSKGIVTNCWNTGAVTGNNYAGGVTGWNDGGSITNCWNVGTVLGKYNYFGGVVGYQKNGSVSQCYFDASVCSYDAIGYNNSGTITNVEGKTTEQFANGEVAYLLGDDFGQNIDNGETVQKLPVLGGAKLYPAYSCLDSSVLAGYSNTENNVIHVTSEKCTVCVCGANFHDYKETFRFDATCNAQGLVRYKCADCGREYDEILDSLGHDYTWSYNDTTHTAVCANCDYEPYGFHDYDDHCVCVCGRASTKKGDHNLNSFYTDASCTEDSYITYFCLDCDTTFVEPGVYEKYGHSGGEATCQNPAFCDVCGEPYGEIGEHAGGVATCAEKAICRYCGEEYGELLEHWADEDYDCTTDDLCYDCGAVVIPALDDHEFDEYHYCTHDYCYVTEKCTFTFVDGDTQTEVEVHYYDYYYFTTLPDKDGLTFLGWDADGDGFVDYAGPDVSSYAYVNGPVAFTAIYGEMFVVRYYRVGLDSGEYELQNVVIVPENGTLNLEYDYSYWYNPLGWATEPNGEIAYNYGEDITVTGTLDLYTVWEPFKATFDMDGGTWLDENGEPVPTVITESSSFYTVPTKVGYIFLYFEGVDQYGSRLIESFYTDDATGESWLSIPVSGNISYTAVWEECTEHSFVGGKCEYCGAECDHVFEDGVCLGCGASDRILGDVSGDGIVTNADVLAIYRYIYNAELYPLNVTAGDVNKDGAITNADVLAIYRYIYNPELYPIG